MLRNILKISLRNLLQRKVYSTINILGLAIGLASCIIIFLFVRYEKSFDDFHKDQDNIFRIVREMTIGDQYAAHATINYSFADLMRENMDIKGVTRLGRFRGYLSTESLDREFEEHQGLFADNEFFSVFDADFISGNKSTALQSPNQIILTKSTAEKYFGDSNPINEVLTMNRGERSFQVVGVIEDWPKNSHIQFDLLVSMASTKGWYSQNMFDHWGNIWTYTYVRTKDHTSMERLDAEANQIAYEFGPEVLSSLNVKFFSQPVGDIYLNSKLEGEIIPTGNKLYVQVFTAIGILILIIACFNFINLSTARASWRAKEVGLRKVVGARRGVLVLQFLGESLFITLIAFTVAIGLCYLVVPTFNEFSSRTIDLGILFSPTAIVLIILLLLSVGIMAGSFPAFLLSSFRPVNVLKGNTSVGNSKLANSLRKSLIVIQFSISISLVVASLTIFYQLEYAKSKPLGYDKEHLIILDLYNKHIRTDIDPLIQELKDQSFVIDISATSDTPPTSLNSWWVDGKGEHSDLHELVSLIAIDHDFVETMKLTIKEGRDLDGRQADESSGVLINEAAVKYFGIQDPIGKPLSLQEGLKEVIITGVVEDFHTASLHEEISPLIMTYHESWFDKVLIRIQPGNYDQVLSTIESSWYKVIPDWSPRYHFLDADFEKAYVEEKKLSQLIVTFAALALFIGALGLFGLANFVADQKTREIGIRKVMGASIRQVVWLQYQSFLTLLFVSFMISIPVVVYLMNDWLDQFAYRITLEWWLFVVAGVFTFGVALGTISLQSIKAALRNPIDALRTE